MNKKIIAGITSVAVVGAVMVGLKSNVVMIQQPSNTLTWSWDSGSWEGNANGIWFIVICSSNMALPQTNWQTLGVTQSNSFYCGQTNDSMFYNVVASNSLTRL